MQMRAGVRWVLSPVLYAVSVLPVFAAVLSIVLLVHWALGYTFAWVIAGAIGLLVIGALGFGLLSLGFVRLERLNTPGALDHLRHCFLLYASIVPLGLFLTIGSFKPCCSLQWTFGAVLFLVAAYAVLLNALTIYRARHRTA